MRRNGIASENENLGLKVFNPVIVDIAAKALSSAVGVPAMVPLIPSSASKTEPLMPPFFKAAKSGSCKSCGLRGAN